MKKKELYFIALVPQEPVFSSVMDLKLLVKEKYQSRRALNSPPHITLQMPFRWREDREEIIHDMLRRSASAVNRFRLILNGFGFFEPRVVYVDVEESTELEVLHESVKSKVKRELKLVNELGERPFRPHMTIAFRDLKKPMFYKAMEEFGGKEFSADFKVEDICLLKHNGSTWDIYRRYELA